MPFSPSIIQESAECKRHFQSFRQCREQLDLFNKRIQEKCKFYIVEIRFYKTFFISIDSYMQCSTIFIE